MVNLFTIRPAQPAGPFSFGGSTIGRIGSLLDEIMSRGYEAHRQFIEPVVGASGGVVATRQGSLLAPAFLALPSFVQEEIDQS